MIPPKLSKPPLRRIVDQESRSFSAFTGKAIFKLDCGHTIYMRPQAGLMESWRRVRCKECVR